MTDQPATQLDLTKDDLPDHLRVEDVVQNRFALAALEREKREGLELAVRARWIGLAVVAVLIPILNFHWSMLYYHALLALLAYVGWLQRRFGRVGRSRMELLLILVDLALMCFALTFPNPFDPRPWPDTVVYQFDNFPYLYLILASATLAYSWRTIFAVGIWGALLWVLTAVLIWWFGRTDPDISRGLAEILPHDPELAEMIDPNLVHWNIRLQEIVVFVIVAFTLAIGVRRFNQLLLGNAALERERANLSRYFSPNVVDELSRNDEPLKQVRIQNVAVMFVDIVGFTGYAASRDAHEVIATLRAFHSRMETDVFSHGGTLDKFLGDGLMATFGTPLAGDRDASNALDCARAMLQSVDALNAERAALGAPAIQVSIGLHYGPVVLGDIGSTQLEFAVIGNTVNVASRLEALTRTLGARIVLSDDMRRQIAAEQMAGLVELPGFERQDGAAIRGLDHSLTVWSLP
ncbi:MAG: adenylate/guanylate cyclase domain-containing protein [Marinibacterium sp.]|nr:adenylate/guanylate cyclase domain-containing protein [Marinibacterium sp.]